MGGLSFLTKKNFNPANWSNQKAVWEARQRVAQEERLAKERAEQLKRERDDEQLARAIGGDRGGDQAALKFMYGAPAGNSDEKNSDEEHVTDEKVSGESTGFGCERRPGDDAAAAKFRMLFAKKAKENDPSVYDAEENKNILVSRESDGLNRESADVSSNVASKEDDGRTALEKAVGRKAAAGLSLEEQIARFPHLKHAPMAAGMAGTNVNVTFKPLGATIRNVRCMACGEWGHAKGERECSKSFNPFALSSGKERYSEALSCDIVSDRNNTTGQQPYPSISKEEENESYSSKEERRRHKKRSSHHKKHKRRKTETKESNRKRSRSRSRSRERKYHRKR